MDSLSSMFEVTSFVTLKLIVLYITGAILINKVVNSTFTKAGRTKGDAFKPAVEVTTLTAMVI